MSDQNGARPGFDANERAAKREAGPISIGDATYFPARLTNKRLRQVRREARVAGLQAQSAAKDSEDYKEAYDEAIAAGKPEDEAKKVADEAGMGSDEVAEINAKSLATQLPILLRDENQQPPSEETVAKHLDDDLDARDVEGLMNYLLGADPTPTPTGTTTTS